MESRHQEDVEPAVHFVFDSKNRRPSRKVDRRKKKKENTGVCRTGCRHNAGHAEGKVLLLWLLRLLISWLCVFRQ